MSRPASLVGATITVKIEGVDLKDYGVVVNRLDDNTPPVRDASDIIPLRNGSLDNSQRYDSKQLTLMGDIMGDTAALLQSNIDNVKNLVRLRQDATLFGIELQNRTGYDWNVRLVSLSISPKASWFAGTKAAFTLTVKAVGPYAEKTTSTVSSAEMIIASIAEISYGGTFPTPLSVEAVGHEVENLLSGKSEATTGWTPSNCTMATFSSDLHMYGTVSLKANRTAGGAYYTEQDILSTINTSKYYVCSAYSKTGPTKLQIITDAGGGQTFESVYSLSGRIDRVSIKIDGSDFIGQTVTTFRLYSDGTPADFDFDGVSINEITAAEYADSGYETPAYVEGTRDFSNAKFTITGKNLCPAGAADMDKASWSDADDIQAQYDSEIDAVALLMYVPAHSDSFHLASGETYYLSLKYRCLGGTNVGLRIDAMGELGAATDRTYSDGTITSDLITADDTWRTFTKQFTMPSGVVWARLGIDAGSPAFTHLRLAEIQIEKGTSGSTFETYRAKWLNIFLTLSENQIAVADSRYKSLVIGSDVASKFSNGAQYLRGEFLELWPGTNNIITDDNRRVAATPEVASSGHMTYRIKYVERKL